MKRITSEVGLGRIDENGDFIEVSAEDYQRQECGFYYGERELSIENCEECEFCPESNWGRIDSVKLGSNELFTLIEPLDQPIFVRGLIDEVIFPEGDITFNLEHNC
jgi:hypothetical protein